mmetsp:Transcript_27471/g.63508  ORF Transcript_27471/g.63508 Transcript_27471/m.63508 type:complete len:165 (-) Transcript_27471:910-1404(-)
MVTVLALCASAGGFVLSLRLLLLLEGLLLLSSRFRSHHLTELVQPTDLMYCPVCVWLLLLLRLSQLRFRLLRLRLRLLLAARLRCSLLGLSFRFRFSLGFRYSGSSLGCGSLNASTGAEDATRTVSGNSDINFTSKGHVQLKAPDREASRLAALRAISADAKPA